MGSNEQSDRDDGINRSGPADVRRRRKLLVALPVLSIPAAGQQQGATSQPGVDQNVQTEADKGIKTRNSGESGSPTPTLAPLVRLAARAPGLDIWSQGLVERLSGGWKITAKGRAVLEVMESRPAAVETALPAVESPSPFFPESVPPLRQPADRAKRRRERRERRREARERAKANAS